MIRRAVIATTKPAARGLFVALVLACALGGCEAIPYSRGPVISSVWLTFTWSTPEEILARCGAGIGACTQPGSVDSPRSVIWAARPSAFSDYGAVCRIGHEVLHSLGARHGGDQ